MANATKAEKLTILAARLMEFEEALHQSKTKEEYKDSIESIKGTIDVVLGVTELDGFRVTAKKLEIKLRKLEVGEIDKRQVSCQELYKEIVIEAAKKINR